MGIPAAPPVWISAIENEQTGFTPVRRRESTINTRYLNTELEVEWTAQKCNRLLRALTSRVAVLKKDLSRYQSSSAATAQISTAILPRGTKRDVAQSQDAEWTLGRKRVKQTYSARGRGIGRGGSSTIDQPSQGRVLVDKWKHLNPGEFLVPTPVLNRARSGPVETQTLPISYLGPQTIEVVEIPGKKRSRVKDGDKHFHLTEMMRELKKKLPAGRYSTCEGIYSGLETLLRSTAKEGKEPKRKGPLSLLSMCLKAVPRYIAQEEAILDAQLEETGGKSAINNKDVSTEIYDDLEAFGSHGHGWKQLRLIVRSHGVQVICDAIQERLLDVDFCGILIKLCIKLDAVTEGRSILSSVLSIRKYTIPKTISSRITDEQENQPLSLLWDIVEEQKCFSFQYRELSQLFLDKVIPLDWIATREFGAVLTRAIQALTSASTNSDAVIFIETILSMLTCPFYTSHQSWSGLKGTELTLSKATMQTFSSLLTTLTSIVILSREGTAEGTLNESSCIEFKHVAGVLRGALIHWKHSHQLNPQGTLLLLANMLAEVEGSEGPFNDTDIIINHLRQSKETAEDLASKKGIASFVCSVAGCCGRGAFTTGFEHSKRLHLLLERISDTRNANEAKLLHKIIVDSAFAFAHEVADQEHFEYASAWEEKLHLSKTSSDQSCTPGNTCGNPRVGYRWEEGISEWVTATPAANSQRNETSIISSTLSDDYECDTPYRPNIRQKSSRAGGKSQVQPFRSLSPDSNADHDNQEEIYRGTRETSVLDFEVVDDNINDETLADSPQPSIYSTSNSNSIIDDEMIDNNDNNQAGLSSPSSTGSRDSNDPLEQSFLSIESSTLSSRINSSQISRQYIDRAPRLSRRVLRQSLQWQLFDDESDDELSHLSFHSSSSSQAEKSLKDITNIPLISNPQNKRKTSYATRERAGRKVDSSTPLCDSEDELCS